MCGCLARGRCEDGRDSAALRLRHLGAARGGPGNYATAHDLTVVRAVLVYVVHERARVRRIPKQPGAISAGLLQVAERTRIVNLVQSPLEGSGKRL